MADVGLDSYHVATHQMDFGKAVSGIALNGQRLWWEVIDRRNKNAAPQSVQGDYDA